MSYNQKLHRQNIEIRDTVNFSFCVTEIHHNYLTTERVNTKIYTYIYLFKIIITYGFESSLVGQTAKRIN